MRLRAHVLLAHPREQEHLVVDRQRERDDEDPGDRDDVELARAAERRVVADEQQREDPERRRRP